MSSLIQISDTHFGTERSPIVTALLDLVSRLKPVVAVLSGDITQRARRSEFRTARKFTDQLEVPHWLAIPGNHDIPLFNLMARIFCPYAGFQQVFGSVVEPQLECDGFHVIGVNTTRPTRYRNGEISQVQVERVTRALRQNSKHRLKVVVTHQPVHVLTHSELKHRVHGYRRAVDAWASAGADLIMGGHIHLPYVAPLHNAFPELSRRCWIVQGGTALSHRVRANYPNSVNIVHYTSGSMHCRIERWDYEGATRSFRCVEAREPALDHTAH